MYFEISQRVLPVIANMHYKKLRSLVPVLTLMMAAMASLAVPPPPDIDFIPNDLYELEDVITHLVGRIANTYSEGGMDSSLFSRFKGTMPNLDRELKPDELESILSSCRKMAGEPNSTQIIRDWGNLRSIQILKQLNKGKEGIDAGLKWLEANWA